MRPLLTALATFVSILLATASASAVTFSVTELSGCEAWDPADGCGLGIDITIGIRVDAGPDEELLVAGASAYGYDPTVASFTGGEAVSHLFHAFADPNVGTAGGVSNQSGGALNETGGHVNFLSAVSQTPFGTQPLDPGLDGVVGGGDAMFRLTFTIVGSGSTTVKIGVDPATDAIGLADGSRGTANEIQLVISSGLPPSIVVVPEPATAAFLGLGLGGVARWRRPSRIAA